MISCTDLELDIFNIVFDLCSVNSYKYFLTLCNSVIISGPGAGEFIISFEI